MTPPASGEGTGLRLRYAEESRDPEVRCAHCHRGRAEHVRVVPDTLGRPLRLDEPALRQQEVFLCPTALFKALE